MKKILFIFALSIFMVQGFCSAEISREYGVSHEILWCSELGLWFILFYCV